MGGLYRNHILYVVICVFKKLIFFLRYIYVGQHCGASMYRNVRGWCLLRQPMDEIPELGIQASNSYQTDAGLDVAESYHTTAGMK